MTTRFNRKTKVQSVEFVDFVYDLSRMYKQINKQISEFDGSLGAISDVANNFLTSHQLFRLQLSATEHYLFEPVCFSSLTTDPLAIEALNKRSIHCSMLSSAFYLCLCIFREVCSFYDRNGLTMFGKESGQYDEQQFFTHRGVHCLIEHPTNILIEKQLSSLYKDLSN